MAEIGALPSPTEKFRRPTLPFFINFASKPFLESEPAAMSPTSILDSKPFSGFRNPFTSPRTPEPTEPNKRNWEKLDSRHIGLGIVDSFAADEKANPEISNPETRMVLFGSQLKIQIPPLSPPSPTYSPKSPEDFEAKGRNPQVGSFSSSLLRSPSVRKLETVHVQQTPHRVGCLPAGEMELSEDYTCVIAHGPNPRTTHIFDDCVIESYCGPVASYSAVGSKKENGFLGKRCSFPSESFLSFCHACKKNLGQGKDIYMLRGEKGFCSRECRYQEMMMEEEKEKLGSEDVLHDATFS